MLISKPARAFVAFLLLASLSACADRLADAERIAEPAGMKRVEVAAPPFLLTAFEHVSDAAAPVVIYIEGDGAAWSSESEPSLDPTPRRALGLRLAAVDRAANVIYLARPCQFTKHDPFCNEHYWTDRRFAPEVIDSMNRAVDELLGRDLSTVKPEGFTEESESPASNTKPERDFSTNDSISKNHAVGARHGPIELVGYSGGAAVAALIAARRHDVARLRTVAGNLDPVALARYHNVSPLTGSLSPMDVAGRLAALPQQHFVGTHDEVVPGFVAENFVAAEGRPPGAVIVPVDAGHEAGWVEFWRGL